MAIDSQETMIGRFQPRRILLRSWSEESQYRVSANRFTVRLDRALIASARCNRVNKVPRDFPRTRGEGATTLSRAMRNEGEGGR